MSATSSELLDAIKKTRSAINKFADSQEELAARVENNESEMTEQRKQLSSLVSSFQNYSRQLPLLARGSSERDPDYKGFWSSEHEAADFGHLVLANSHPDSGIRTSSAEHVAKGGYTIRRNKGQFAKGDDYVKAMGIGDGTSGGFLVPDEFSNKILRFVEQYGVFRRNATPVPMSSERQPWPKRTGGFTVYYPDEGVAATPSDLAFGTVTLTAKRWSVLTYYSKELGEDSVVPLGELLAVEFALAIAQAEDKNGFLGDGTSAYAGVTGVLGSSNVAVVTLGGGDTTFNKVEYADLVDLAFAVPSWVHDQPDCAFYMSPYMVGLCMRMTDENGQPLFQRPSEAFPMEIAGFPVKRSTVLPGLAASGASKKFIAFGSLKSWGMLGQRRSMTIAQSSHVKFIEGQIAVLCEPRQDIQESEGEAMSVLKTAAA